MAKVGYFYNKTFRSVSTCILYLFSNIQYKNADGKLQVVPCKFAGSDRFYFKDAAVNYSSVNTFNSFPLFSINLESFSFVSDIQQQKTKYYSSKSLVDSEYYADTPVYYTLNYSVILAFKKMDEMFQIVEQILPRFKPNVHIKKTTFKDINLDDELNVNLDSISTSITNDINFNNTEDEIHEVSFNLSVLTRFYGEQKDNKIITGTNISAEPTDVSLVVDESRL